MSLLSEVGSFACTPLKAVSSACRRGLARTGADEVGHTPAGDMRGLRRAPHPDVPGRPRRRPVLAAEAESAVAAQGRPHRDDRSRRRANDTRARRPASSAGSGRADGGRRRCQSGRRGSVARTTACAGTQTQAARHMGRAPGAGGRRRLHQPSGRMQMDDLTRDRARADASTSAREDAALRGQRGPPNHQCGASSSAETLDSMRLGFGGLISAQNRHEW